MPRKSRIVTESSDQRILDGIATNFSTLPGLRLAGRPFTPATLSAAIRRRIEAARRARQLQAEWYAASLAYAETDAEVRRVVHDLKAFVFSYFGVEDLEHLAEFGFAPPKVHERTPAEKLVVAAKGKATRQARHTKGPKAKLAITGLNPTGTPWVAAPVVTVRPIESGAGEGDGEGDGAAAT